MQNKPKLIINLLLSSLLGKYKNWFINCGDNVSQPEKKILKTSNCTFVSKVLLWTELNLDSIISEFQKAFLRLADTLVSRTYEEPIKQQRKRKYVKQKVVTEEGSVSLIGKKGILCLDNASYSSVMIEQLFIAASRRLSQLHTHSCPCIEIQTSG